MIKLLCTTCPYDSGREWSHDGSPSASKPGETLFLDEHNNRGGERCLKQKRLGFFFEMEKGQRKHGMSFSLSFWCRDLK